MKRKLLIISTLILIAGLLITPVCGAAELFKIAVLPFDDGSIQNRWWGEQFELGKGISDELVTALLKTGKFRLVEREQINAILQEQKIGAAGLVDPKSAAEIGRLLGVQYLVIGRVTEFSQDSQTFASGSKKGGLALVTSNARVAIDARLVDTTTAEILTSVTGKGKKETSNLGMADAKGGLLFGSKDFQKTDLGKALREAVDSVANQLAVKAYDGKTIKVPLLTGLIAYADPNRGTFINIGKDQGVKVGMNFLVTHIIDEIKDPKTGEVLDQISEPVAEVTITEVREKVCVCVVLNKLSDKYEIAVGDLVKQKKEKQQ